VRALEHRARCDAVERLEEMLEQDRVAEEMIPRIYLPLDYWDLLAASDDTMDHEADECSATRRYDGRSTTRSLLRSSAEPSSVRAASRARRSLKLCVPVTTQVAP
jgi:hypothetical protein